MSVPARRSLRVIIDARLVSGQSGGVEGIVTGLAMGLSALTDGSEEFAFVAWPGHEAWLEPHLSGPARLVLEVAPERSRRQRLGDAFPGLRAAWRQRPGRADEDGPPRSDRFVEGLGGDVIHFPLQRAFLTSTPTIFHPHDLQHVHFPEFFSAAERDRRERWYGAFCRQAAMVAVASRWTKHDVERHYRLDTDKVRVVPLAPSVGIYPDATSAGVEEARRRLDLPAAFVLYPAQTWPHKNHIGLLEALARLRDDRDLVVPLVAPGQQNDYFPTIEERASELGVSDQIRWLGFVAPGDLKILYRLARAVVVPSLFEAASGPVWEAFEAGVPVASSNVTSLPEQAGDAALVFDPHDPGAIADAIASLWQDAKLRERLATAGRRRVAVQTWDRTARTFRAHYRRLGQTPLTDADRHLLAEAPAL